MSFKDIRLAASIALTHMRARLKQTIVATTGVAFGITVFIFLISFIMGTNEYFQDVAFEQSPHIRLYNEAQIAEKSLLDKLYPDELNVLHHPKPKDAGLNLKDGKQAALEIAEDSRVRAVSPSLSTQVFYRYGASSINGTVNGILFEAEDALFNISEKLKEGSFNELSTKPNSLVMGTGLADQLSLKTGDRLTVTTQEGGNFLVTIVGIFKTGLTDIDNRQSYASINTVQRFLNVPASYITDIKIKLYDMDQAVAMGEELRHKYDYTVSDWEKDNAAFIEGEKLRGLITYGVSVTVLLVAGFGIYNILTMMIYEKMKDIAILKAMGFSDKDVRWVFLTQALIIGLAGALLGLLFGFLASYGISKMPYESDVVITLDHMPVSFDPMFYIGGFCFGILTTAMAGLMPSRKAARMDPIAILRG